jgi:hypothetical protein
LHDRPHFVILQALAVPSSASFVPGERANILKPLLQETGTLVAALGAKRTLAKTSGVAARAVSSLSKRELADIDHTSSRCATSFQIALPPQRRIASMVWL